MLKMDLVNIVLLISAILLLTQRTNGGHLHHVLDYDTLISKLSGGSTLRNQSIEPCDESDNVVQFAVHKSYSDEHTKHNGLMATMDVYDFTINRDQETAAVIWVGNRGDGTQATQNFILVGWHVKPSLYGDSRTRFFTYWTKDGFQQTGCYNMACPGFQLEAGLHVFPGDVIAPVSRIKGPKQKITVKINKDDKTGDWWVYYGFNTYPTVVGHFPKSLFTCLACSTADFAFGGYISNARTQKIAPMGSGSSDIRSAASFSDLKFILQDGTVSAISGDLPSQNDNINCYLLTPVVNGMFFYGGRGGCPA